MGLDEEGILLCSECMSPSDWNGGLRIESDFIKLTQLFLKRRVLCRKLLAFELIYLLRQFPKIPPTILADILLYVRQLGQPFAEQLPQEQMNCTSHSLSSAAPSRPPALHHKLHISTLVELVSARVVECVILFYLADVDQ